MAVLTAIGAVAVCGVLMVGVGFILAVLVEAFSTRPDLS